MAQPTLTDYARLMRLHQPIGIWLLFFPAAWGVLLAPPTLSWPLLAVMLAGAAITRAAGCVINDMADRHFDDKVARTQSRPLAQGNITLADAYVLLFLLLTAALYLVLLLPEPVLWVACFAVPMMALYPRMKRVTWWPQLWLGLTFNLSAVMGWLATDTPLSLATFALYLAAIVWTLGYDTVYAMQDKADDERIGIKSSARRLGTRVPGFVACCYAAVLALLLFAGMDSGVGLWFFLGLILAGLHFAWQVRCLYKQSPAYGALFTSNQWVGVVLTLALLLERIAPMAAG